MNDDYCQSSVNLNGERRRYQSGSSANSLLASKHLDKKRQKKERRRSIAYSESSQSVSSKSLPSKRRKRESSRRYRNRSASSDESSSDDNRKRKKQKRSKNNEEEGRRKSPRKKSKREKQKRKRSLKGKHRVRSKSPPPLQGISTATPKEIETKREHPKEESPKKLNELEGGSIEEKQKRASRMVPMSQEQFNKEQSIVREVYDNESGRYRLVKGNGEIIERIVSRTDHQRINQDATRGDGSSFARNILAASKR